ncbi:hypothetical protein CEXT_816011 [Caerostris extrusa]|uniref:Secreted protein n=1 Tax=Caerostris extrusa TaxID=172846 RepID=A0AAV4X291_CAEEX|nr:hypothetical protein CEXT_816011 [Caerostris extrusa]
MQMLLFSSINFLLSSSTSFCLRLKYLKIPYIYPSGHDAVRHMRFRHGEAICIISGFITEKSSTGSSPGESPKAMSFLLGAFKWMQSSINQLSANTV